MWRRILVVPVFCLLAACQPQQPPKTAVLAPPQGSIDLPAPETAHRYDTAIKPGDDTRAPGKIAVVRSAARPPADALTEREKAAIARWDREEAALNYDAPPLGLRPPPRTAVALAMPTDATLPRPAAEKAAPATRNDAALPPPIERPAPVEPPAAAEPAKASAPVPPPPAPSAPAAAPPPVESAAPTQTAAAAPIATPVPAEKPLPRPGGEPASVVTFAPRSADVSDGNRLLLERFAKDANVRRVRQILLFGFASGGDPVEARKLALARVLAVHAALIDLGLRANIEIGDFSQANDGSPDRVDVMLR
jgi:hypothetical protein